jgi:hypothetical protein
MKPIPILVLFSLCAMLLVSLATITGCEEGIRLRVANKLKTDIIIVYEGFDMSGTPYGPVTLGAVPPGQEGQLTPLLVLRPEIIGWVLNIRAQDYTGVVIWQNAWTFDEFLKLKKVGWRIQVSPDTGSYLPYN